MADQEEQYILRIKAELDSTLKSAMTEMTKATQEFARRTQEATRTLKEIGPAGDGISEVANDIRDLATTARALNRPAAQVRDVMNETASAMDRWRQSIDRAEQELADLPIKIDLVQQELDQLAASGDTSSARFQTLTNEMERLQSAATGIPRGVQQTGNGLARLRFQAQNAAYQITDFAISLQNGSRASVAFTQQVPQLLGGFGSIGIALSVAAVAVGIFASKWIDDMAAALDPTIAFKRASEDLDETLSNLGREARQVDISYLIEQLGKLEGAGERTLLSVNALDLSKAELQAKTQIDSIIKTYKEALNEQRTSGFTDVFGGLLITQSQQQAVDNFEDSVTRLAKQFGITQQQAQLLDEYLADPKKTENLERILNTTDLYTEKNKELLDAIRDLLIAQEEQLNINEKLKIVNAARADDESKLGKLIHDLTEQQIADDIILAKIEQQKTAEYNAQLLALRENKVISQELYEALLKNVKGADDYAKKVKSVTDEYDEIVKQQETIYETYDREIKAVDALVASLKKLKIPYDEKVIEKYKKDLAEIRDNDAAAQAVKNFTPLTNAMYELAIQTHQTKIDLEEYNKILATGTPEQIAAATDHMGKLAPAAQRVSREWEKLTESEEDIRKLNAAIDDFAAANNLSAEQIEDLRRATGTLAKDTKKDVDSMEQAMANYAVNTLGQVSDALVDAAFTGEEAWSDMIDSILAGLAKLALNKMFVDVFNSFFPNYANGGSGVGSSGAGAAAGAGNPRSASQFDTSPQYAPLVPTRRAASSPSGGLGGATTVNVYNQSGTEATVTERQSNYGRTIDVVVANSVDNAIAQGRFDRSLNTFYGLRRRGY